MDPPLLGRDREIARLADSLRDLANGGGTILIRGDAGIGKTSLLQASARMAAARGDRVLTTVGVEFGGESAVRGPPPTAAAHPWPDRKPARGTARCPAGRLRCARWHRSGDLPRRNGGAHTARRLGRGRPGPRDCRRRPMVRRPHCRGACIRGAPPGGGSGPAVLGMRDGYQSPLLTARLPELRLEPLDERSSERVLEGPRADAQPANAPADPVRGGGEPLLRSSNCRSPFTAWQHHRPESAARFRSRSDCRTHLRLEPRPFPTLRGSRCWLRPWTTQRSSRECSRRPHA